jgi:hypothetical protein
LYVQGKSIAFDPDLTDIPLGGHTVRHIDIFNRIHGIDWIISCNFNIWSVEELRTNETTKVIGIEGGAFVQHYDLVSWDGNTRTIKNAEPNRYFYVAKEKTYYEATFDFAPTSPQTPNQVRMVQVPDVSRKVTDSNLIRKFDAARKEARIQ